MIEVLRVRVGRGAAGFHQLVATLHRKGLTVHALAFVPAEERHEIVVAVEVGARSIATVVAAIERDPLVVEVEWLGLPAEQLSSVLNATLEQMHVLPC